MGVKYENNFDISEFYRSQTFGKVENLMIFSIFSKFSIFFEIKEEKIREEEREGSCSTSYSSGNQVDGLPLVAIPKHQEKERAGGPAHRYSWPWKTCFQR